ncbi:MAG: hypothetical protein K2Q06_06765 [Parvularculaceae bacterium]|nr:hypothetical protein [Parvularculaceae bacterium]
MTTTGTLGFESRYLFRGLELSQESFQPAVTFAKGGLSATAWFNFPIDNADPVARRGEELDIVLSYAAPVSETVKLEAGFTYYTYPERDRGFFDVFNEDGDGLGANSFEPYVAVAFTAPLSPKIYLFRDVFFDTTTVQGNLAHSIPLSDKASFDLSGQIGYVFDDAGGADYLYGHALANVTYKVTDKASVYAGGRFGGSNIAGGGVIDGPGLRKSSGLWAGAGLTFSF